MNLKEFIDRLGLLQCLPELGDRMDLSTDFTSMLRFHEGLVHFSTPYMERITNSKVERAPLYRVDPSLVNYFHEIAVPLELSLRLLVSNPQFPPKMRRWRYYKSSYSCADVNVTCDLKAGNARVSFHLLDSSTRIGGDYVFSVRTVNGTLYFALCDLPRRPSSSRSHPSHSPRISRLDPQELIL